MSEVLEKLLDQIRHLRHTYYRFENMNRTKDADECLELLTQIKRTSRILKAEIALSKKVIDNHLDKLDELLLISKHKKEEPGTIKDGG